MSTPRLWRRRAAAPCHHPSQPSDVERTGSAAAPMTEPTGIRLVRWPTRTRCVAHTVPIGASRGQALARRQPVEPAQCHSADPQVGRRDPRHSEADPTPIGSQRLDGVVRRRHSRHRPRPAGPHIASTVRSTTGPNTTTPTVIRHDAADNLPHGSIVVARYRQRVDSMTSPAFHTLFDTWVTTSSVMLTHGNPGHLGFRHRCCPATGVLLRAAINSTVLSGPCPPPAVGLVRPRGDSPAGRDHARGGTPALMLMVAISS